MKRILKLIIIIVALMVLINIYMIIVSNKKIVKADDIKEKDFDCIIVLGAGIKNRQPSPMLEDRLLTAIELYNKGYAPKILVSGDHENADYDEVNVMKNYLKEKDSSWYEKPGNVVGCLVDPISGKPATEDSKNKKILYYLKGTEPTGDEMVFDEMLKD